VEEQISFLCGDLQLEGLWRPQGAERAVVVAHPHPLYGGDMHNSVVASVADSFANKGFATLRFNFRGTGASEGDFDDGLGEQRDLAAALGWVAQRIATPPCVAGYSFGAWVAAGAAAAGYLGSAPLYLVSPPVALLSFATISASPSLAAVVAGDRDDFAPLPQVKGLLERWQAAGHLEVIEGCDHFYSGRLAQLGDALAPHIPAAAPTSARGGRP
jgi:alpha/beta superfamily hydrolase